MFIAYSPIYKYQLPEGHRFPMIKYELLPQQIMLEGLATEADFFSPKRLTDQEILHTHTEEYLHKLLHLPLPRKEERAIGFPVKNELIERGRYIASGTYECAKYALEHGCALNIAGGTHHAYADQGGGFCVFNDFAIAANLLLKRKELSKILIVDLDVHQGNGTAKIFEAEDRIFTFSMHGKKNYPLRKERSDLDIELDDGTRDDDYLSELKNVLPSLILDTKPDLMMYLSGVDVLEQDKLGRLSMTMAGCRSRDQFVFECCKKFDIPVCVSMGGGYSEKISDIISAHTNTYRMAFDIFT